MATDYLTTDTELKSVADAIRAKGGTSAVLVYPTGYVSAIQAIQTGVDVSDTTATAADVLEPAEFYLANGTKTTGTAAYLDNAYSFDSVAVKSATTSHYLTDLPGYDPSSITTNATAVGPLTTWSAMGHTLALPTKDYLLVINNWLQFVWINSSTVGAGRPIINAQTYLYYMSKTPTAATGLGTWSYGNELLQLHNVGVLYYNNAATTYSRLYNAGYGFYIVPSLSLSSASTARPSLTVKYTCYARCHNTYFKTSYLEDMQNDMMQYHISATLYEIPKQKNWGYLNYWDLLLNTAKNNYDPNLHPEY